MERKNNTLLVVDSSASHRFYLGTTLRKLKYTVHIAASVEAAVQLMADILPSLVITEFAPPEMNGIALLTRMKQDHRLKSVPIIIQSANDGPEIREQCMTAGCTAYFKKPAEIEELYKAIEAGLDSPRQTVRVGTAFKVEVGNKKATGGSVRQESVTELSDGGLYIRTLTPEPIKAVVPLTLFIEDKVIRATAVVLYISQKTGGQDRGSGMGMKFIQIDEKDRAFIRDYVKKQISKGLSIPYD